MSDDQKKIRKLKRENRKLKDEVTALRIALAEKTAEAEHWDAMSDWLWEEHLDGLRR